MRVLVAGFLAILFFCCPLADNWGAEPEVRFNLLTLASARMAANRLAAPAQIAYENVTLRASIGQLAEHYQFSYWIDRRVDADSLISLKLQDATVGRCVAGLARLCDAEMGLVENVVTIAPADRLAAMQYTAVRLHDQLSRTSPAADHPAQLRPLEWPVLTTPSELAAQVASDWGLQLKVALPHDLMNAGRLQPCTLATQLTLLLGGFNQCAVGRSPEELRIAQLPTAAPWQAIYAKSSFPQTQLANWPTIAADFPGARLIKNGNNVIVAGPTAVHLRMLTAEKSAQAANAATGATSVAAAGGQAGGDRRENPRRTPRTPRGNPSGDPRTSSAPGSSSSSADPLAQQRITFSKVTDQPISSVVAAISRQMGFRVDWDPSLTAANKMALVTLEAKGESLDAILQRMAGQTGLAIVRQGSVVTLSPGENAR